MTRERENILATREIKSVRYTENNAALLLEYHLGIVIPEHPKTVILSPRNRLALYRDPDFRRRKGFSLLNVFLKNSTSFAGCYEDTSNTCILFQEPRENYDEAALHEAMHAYSNQTNPESFNKPNKVFQQARNNPLGFDHDAIEAHCIFQEGIATWGCWETIARIQGQPNYEASDKMHKEAMKVILHIDDRDLTNDDIMEQFTLITERGELWKKIVSDIYNPYYKDDFKQYSNMTAERVIQDNVYGHYFVHNVISELTAKGIKTGDALTKLILGPPQTLEELKDPIAFSYNLIGKEL